MHNYAWLWMILRLCHEWGQNKRWGAVRHVIVSGIPMRVFFIFIFSKKNRFLDVWTFHVFGWRFWICLLEKWFDPKMPQKCLGPLWDHPRPILDHSGPILTKNRLTTEITKSYKNPIIYIYIYIYISTKISYIIPRSYPLIGADMWDLCLGV